MTAHISSKNNPLLKRIDAKMSKTPTTMRKVVAGLKGYEYGSVLTIVLEDGSERDVEIEGLDDVIMVEGDRRLKLHVKCGTRRFMIFVYMYDVRRDLPRARVAIWSPNKEHLIIEARPAQVATAVQ